MNREMIVFSTKDVTIIEHLYAEKRKIKIKET